MCRIQRSVFVLTALAVIELASSQTPTLVTFDNLAQGPSLYYQAGAMQTITVPGVATFTGGVILGYPTNFPAITSATAPNVYGTASTDIGASSTLSPTIDIAIDPSFQVNEVEFRLFNGLPSLVSYRADAFSNGTLVSTWSLSNLVGNTFGGNALMDLDASNITDVKIYAVGGSSQWDFLIDNVAFNGAPQPATPEPSSIAALGLGSLALAWRRNRRS